MRNPDFLIHLNNTCQWDAYPSPVMLHLTTFIRFSVYFYIFSLLLFSFSLSLLSLHQPFLPLFFPLSHILSAFSYSFSLPPFHSLIFPFLPACCINKQYILMYFYHRGMHLNSLPHAMKNASPYIHYISL